MLKTTFGITLALALATPAAAEDFTVSSIGAVAQEAARVCPMLATDPRAGAALGFAFKALGYSPERQALIRAFCANWKAGYETAWRERDQTKPTSK